MPPDARPGLGQFDVVGYARCGIEFCPRCAPHIDRHEAFELHRFEVEGECDQCGTVLALTTQTLGASR